MVGFLWTVSNMNEVIRDNSSASLSKGIGGEENSHKREVARTPSQIITYKCINCVIRNMHGKWNA